MNRGTKKEELYVGSTYRSVRKRTDEHIADFESEKGNMALAQRLISYDATAKWGETKVIKVIDDPQKVRVAETFEIFSRKVKRLNIINFNEPEKISTAWEYEEYTNSVGRI